jgi:outer membrane lipoprotein-sorting protein
MRAIVPSPRGASPRILAFLGSVVAAVSAAVVLLTAASGPASASASAAEPAASAPPALAAFARAWDGVTGYRATVSVYSQKGTDAQHIVFDYTFHKPSMVGRPSRLRAAAAFLRRF